MATLSKTHRPKSTPGSQRLVLLCIFAVALLLIFSSVMSTGELGLPYRKTLIDYFVKSPRSKRHHSLSDKYLYWGNRIDCPGKNCETCAGLGHQESSLRCALEEAMFLNRTFVMPSRMCINPIHNKKGILNRSNNQTTDESWEVSSCAMDSLYDIDLISEKIPVILDDSEAWHIVLSTSMKLGKRGIAHVYGANRHELNDSSHFANLLLINRTASPLAWFVECKDRSNRSAVMLPYSFLPNMAASRLRNAAEKIKAQLGDYDAIHVRRGDKLKTRKDRFHVERSQFPHLDRDTRPEFIMGRIQKQIPPGRTLFIGSNERTSGFFSPLSIRYKVAYSSNFSEILDPIIENNYQLFMVERLIMMGAKTFFKTFREYETDLTLTDDQKKSKNWEIPVYTMDEGKDEAS
ncbi:LOW QUALITY PROTEIN: uncharacterized protein LOC18027652 [Eutrema salsugineum]|uniref:LOW QUALITY PROTEIN: uncharacterized protein LOC18027652 n=1 Tax=Eutrema salsugineum TaxID=72664 RepID=UPI000CED3442|nr:LOW QUALITY PROTEIN: uncharacterized protein LOC18027652 [Eutrema salsugineum]